MKLRDYQQQTVDVLFDFLHYNREGAPIAVLPTGAGKSICISAFIKRILDKYPTANFIVLSHVKEIIEQNYQKVVDNLENISAGIFCAGLGKKELNNQVTFASVQSLHSSLDKMAKRNILIIDECHLINFQEDSMYRSIISKGKELNPKLRVIGFTATPFRAKEGLLIDGKDRIFTDIPIELPVLPLITAGYLCPLTTKISHTQANLEKVRTRHGEFAMEEAQEAMSEGDLTDRIISNIIEKAKGRKRWLIFCCNVEHSKSVAKKLNHAMDNVKFCEGYNSTNISCFTVTGETDNDERQQILKTFKRETDSVMAITNCNVLTTGFDAPNVDLVVFMRPTRSLMLYCQMLGRGMRVSDQKKDCLILDYAGNVERFGPIDMMDYRLLIKEKAKKKKYAKKCPQCEEALSPTAKECFKCKHEFEINQRDSNGALDSLSADSTDAEIISKNKSFWFKVQEVKYHKHQKENKTPSLCVVYSNRILHYKEWVCFEHYGPARKKAVQWWRKRWRSEEQYIPKRVNDALEKCSIGLYEPTEIKVRRNGKYWEIIDYKFN